MTGDEIAENILIAGEINRNASVAFDEVVEAMKKEAESLRRISIDPGDLLGVCDESTAQP